MKNFAQTVFVPKINCCVVLLNKDYNINDDTQIRKSAETEGVICSGV